MDLFPYTHKKFNSMPLPRCHKWITRWLRDIYCKVLCDQLSPQTLELLYQNYARVQSWIGISLPQLEGIPEKQWWVEFLSDQFHLHQKKTGMDIREHDLLPKVITGDRISLAPWQGRFPYKVALDNFRSAFNVGSIIRVCDAVGFEEIISGPNSPGKMHPKVKKTSMGSTSWIPENTPADFRQYLQDCKKENYKIIGVETVEGAFNYNHFLWPPKGIIVLGNEEYGISDSILKTCDDFVSIPMYGRKNSINVSNAFAVIAYQICSFFTSR